MTLKRILTGSFIIMICVMMFLNGYTKVTSLYCYADSTTDEWLNVTTNRQLVEAFRYYCKSRDVTIEGSIADGVTTFTTNAFNGLCNTLGIDITALQAEIKYRTDSNGGLQYLFTTTGVTLYNRIFSQFLQDNDLEVGDENVNDLIYSSKYVQLWDDSYILCYVINDTSVIALGESYLKTKADFRQACLNRTTITNIHSYMSRNANAYSTTSMPACTSNTYFELQNVRYSPSFADNGTATRKFVVISDGTNFYCDSNYGIGYDAVEDKYYNICFIDDFSNFQNIGRHYALHSTTNVYPKNSRDANVYIVSNLINNNNYEGDTIINNEGDVINNNDLPNYDPYPDGGGTTTPPSDNTGGGSGEDDTDVTFPNFNFQLPEIDWSLGDLSQKFPFSIPFDLIAFFTVLNAEPQAPAIDADIPLGTWYTWHFEADFSQFDNYAVIIRNVEFIGFCVGLIYLTIRLVKG